MTTFYVTQDEGSMLLSCSTSLELEVIKKPNSKVYANIYKHPRQARHYRPVRSIPQQDHQN